MSPVQHQFSSSDGLTIYGHLSLPAGAGPHPAVVVLTAYLGGALDSQGRYVNVREHEPLVSAGFAVFTVDHRGTPGHGEAFFRRGEIGGRDVDDVIAATLYLAGRPEIDGRRLGLMGTSRGAYTALLALTRAPTLWRAAVLNMGFYDPLAHVRHEHATRPNASPFTHFSRRTWDEVFAYFSDPARNPLRHLGHVRAPLLAIHGRADRIIDVSQTVLLQEAAKAAGIPLALELVSGMDHDLDQRHRSWPRLWKRIVAFFREHLAS